MNRTTKQLTKMALLVALLCVSAYISVPAPWGGIITSLTLVMCLVAFMLSPKDTFVTLVVYDLMGAIGLPVLLVVLAVFCYFESLGRLYSWLAYSLYGT